MNNTIRPPGLTAKMVCTLDHITGGRVILAPGSGWFTAESKSYGFNTWNDVGLVRNERLCESLQVMRGLMTEDVFSFEGKYFQLKDAYCNPKPVQKPYPPIWIAGDSLPTQELMAKHGDVWFMYSKEPDKVAELVRGMRKRRNNPPVQVAISAVGLADKDRDETLKWAEKYAKERRHRFPIPPTVDDVLAANLTGDVAQVCERIEAWIEAGVDHVVIQPIPPMEGTRFFGEKIIHRFT